MQIVMDFDGVFTDPTEEGRLCGRHFLEKIIQLDLKKLDLATEDQVSSWLGELRARMSTSPFDFGWRSQGRISAFTFEDPFVRGIGLADYMDHLVQEGDARAKAVALGLKKREDIKSFSALSEWAFHQLKLKKRADPEAKKWVEGKVRDGHTVTIVSNSSTGKIDEFLDQNAFDPDLRPEVRGGARKFELGNKARLIEIGKDFAHGKIKVDTDRPVYQEALMELEPDVIIGDVFSLDLALPIYLKRKKKLAFEGGIFYRLRDYSPQVLLDFASGKDSLIPEVTAFRDWKSVLA